MFKVNSDSMPRDHARPAVRLLGPVELVCPRGEWVHLPLQRRKVLALLATSVRAPVSTRQLVASLWETEPPSRADRIVREHLRMLRGLLGENVLIKTAAGYRIDPAGCGIDSEDFRVLFADVQRHRSAADFATASTLAGEALSLWRGVDAMPDVRILCELEIEAVYLEALRFNICELLADSLLAGGRSAEVLPLMQTLVMRYPERESLWALMMVAEAMEGRIRDALEVTYRRASHHLMEMTGITAKRIEIIQRAILCEVDGPELLSILRNSRARVGMDSLAS